jgi:hypothetical protein
MRAVSTVMETSLCIIDSRGARELH